MELFIFNYPASKSIRSHLDIVRKAHPLTVKKKNAEIAPSQKKKKKNKTWRLYLFSDDLVPLSGSIRKDRENH